MIASSAVVGRSTWCAWLAHKLGPSVVHPSAVPKNTRTTAYPISEAIRSSPVSRFFSTFRPPLCLCARRRLAPLSRNIDRSTDRCIVQRLLQIHRGRRARSELCKRPLMLQRRDEAREETIARAHCIHHFHLLCRLEHLFVGGHCPGTGGPERQHDDLRPALEQLSRTNLR